MKKSLIALSVLAVAGTASAQSNVTVSGKFAAAYTNQSTNTVGTNVAVSSNGFGVTDGNVTFAASENLGGGLKAGVSMDVRVRGRVGAAGGSVEGRDAVVYVEGGFGNVTVGSIELANGILELGGAGAPTQGLDGAVSPSGDVTLEDVINADIFAYTSPALADGLTASLILVDSATAPGVNGMQNTAATPEATLVALNYAKGPVTVSADYTTYDFNAFTGAYQDRRFRVSGSYDLGTVKLGAGYQSMDLRTVTAGVVSGVARADKQYILGVSAPVGPAWVVGANYTRRTNDVAGFNAITGWDLGAQYNLSKRTNVQLGYRRAAEDTFANNNTSTRVRLMHTF